MGDQFQILGTMADAGSLRGEDQTGEEYTLMLPLGSNLQKILVLREQQPAQVGCSLE